MPSKVRFNKYNSKKEQALYESLNREAIRFKGEMMYYLPRKEKNYDPLFGEDDQRYFDDAIPMDIYIKSFDAMGGQGQLLSKLTGMSEIRDQVVFQVSIAALRDAMRDMGYDHIQRAREGDLIYFPLNKKCFEITYVEPYSMFYQLGNLTTQDLTCQLFEYKSEHFSTGIAEIDSIEDNLTQDMTVQALKFADGSPILLEDGKTYLMPEGEDVMDGLMDDGKVIDDETLNGLLDFSETDPFSEGTY